MGAVFGLLLTIYFFLKWFDFYGEEEGDHTPYKLKLLLSGFSYGWIGVLTTSFYPERAIAFYFLTSFVGAVALVYVLPFIYQKLALADKRKIPSHQLVDSTGQVLKRIPPNQEGVGKIHLHTTRHTYRLKAATVGQELRRGVPIRVIDILKDGTLLVEGVRDEGPNEKR